MKIIDKLKAIDGVSVTQLSYHDTRRVGYAIHLNDRHILTIEPTRNITDKFKWEITANNTGMELPFKYGAIGQWLIRILNKLT